MQGVRGDQVSLAACRPLSGDVLYDTFSLSHGAAGAKNAELEQRLAVINPREVVVNPKGMDNRVKEQIYR